MIAVCAIATLPMGARAGQIVVGNLNQSPDLVTGPSFIDAEDFWAQEFTTGGGTYTLQNIFASLGPLTPTLTLTAQLWEVPIGSPTTPPDPTQGATLLDTLTLNGTIPNSGYNNRVEFDPTVTVTLDANHAYWFELSASPNDTGSLGWNFTQSTTVEGPGSLPNFATFTPDTGWIVTPASGDVFGPQMIEVDAVPEPSTAALASIGLAMVFAVRRRLLKLRRRA
jgi:hypothetical protein